MVEYVQHFTTSTPDSEGRYLVGSDQVVDVFYYDASEESWRRDFSTVQERFVNGTFTATTVTGSAPNIAGNYWYETGTDATAVSRYFKFGKIPFNLDDNVLAKYGTVLTSTPTSRGTTNSVVIDYFSSSTLNSSTPPRNVFPGHYGQTLENSTFWATTSGLGGPSGAGEHGLISWSLSESVSVAGFYIDSYTSASITDAEAAAQSIGYYEIQVAASGTGLLNSDYVTVASGTNPLGNVHPIWVEIAPTPARYVRVRFRNNGSLTRATLGKFYVYTQSVIDSGMAMMVSKITEADGVTNGNSRTFALNQDVDLTGIDRVYFDVKDHARRTADIYRTKINGTDKTQIQLVNTVSNTIMTTEIRGCSVDTSGAGANSTFSFTKRVLEESGSPRTMALLANVSVFPGWYRESASSKRGSKAAFPEKTIIVSDTAGLSIIDADTHKLWMRFDLGARKMLQELPLKIVAKNGKIYLATARGLFIIDFVDNSCTRFDSRGPRKRHGIRHRNENEFDAEEWTPNDASIPDWLRYGYNKEYDTPVLPSYGIYDIAVGTDGTFGNYILLGTDKGLILYNEAYGGSSATYTSSDDRPVYKVKVVDGKVWYLQGEKAEQILNYLPSISAAAVASFTPSVRYYKDVSYFDSLSGELDTSKWELVQQDPSMALSVGDVLTISGTHAQGGATGIILKDMFPNRSFTATVKVKLKDFPADARGAVRFGVCRDYHPVGPLSLASNLGASDRSGFFISAFNADPYGWPLPESSPFTYTVFGKDRGWFYGAQIPSSASSSERTKLAQPTISGVSLRAYNGSPTGTSPTFWEDLNRISTVPYLARDFIIRADVQAFSGFSAPTSTSTIQNPNAFFGITRHNEFTPGTGGTGNYIDAAMVIGGNTTYSGVLVYTTAAYSSLGYLSGVSLTQPKIPVSAPDSTGSYTTPYREWRLDYDSGRNRLDCYLDSQTVGTISGTTYVNPHRIGLTFGVSSSANSGATTINRFVHFKNVRVEYPTLISGSRYKYGLEISNTSTGDLQHVPAFYTTYSGISKTGDTVPTSGTLSTVLGLADGNFVTGITSISQNTSVGVALDLPKTVEALYVYDTISGTSGWATSAQKRVDVYRSDDNLSWTFVKRYDMNAGERVSGLTKIRFSPAIEAKFIKFTAVDTTYTVNGGTPWAVSEIRAATVSGVDFVSGDLTEDAEFHEWKLEYNRDLGLVKGYIDGNLVTTGSFTGSLKGSRLMLLHDLSATVSGSGSQFSAEFKDLNITFAGTGALASGTITSIDVLHNELPGGNPNFTLVSASDEGVAVADYDFGSSPIADLIRKFDHTAIFGDSEYVATVVPEEVAHRNTGLVFVGTSSGMPAYYRKRIKRPVWYDRHLTESYNVYGSSWSWGYHWGEGKVLVLHYDAAPYFSLLDLDTGLRTQLGRIPYKEAFGIADTSPLNSSTPVFTYNPYDDNMFVYAQSGRFCMLDVRTGGVTQIINTASADTSNALSDRYYVSYALHLHRTVHGLNNISVMDVATRTLLQNPQYPSSNTYRWSRLGAPLPWTSATNSDDTGSIRSVYSEYDKAVYIVGVLNANYFGTVYFLRFFPDKNYLEVIGSSSASDTWPKTDSQLYGSFPFIVPTENTISMAYDPRRRRIYFISSHASKGVLMYYDVVEQRWVDTGQSPPMDTYRDWPTGITASNSSFAVYDLKKDRLLFSSGAGDESGSYIFEYYPSRDIEEKGFDYVPSRDGLPCTTGRTRQFTTMSGIIPSSSSTWDRDFYYTAVGSTQRYVYTHGVEYVTISGNNPGADTNDVYELYVSSEAVSPHRSFDVSMQVALPTFQRRVFVASGAARTPQAFFIFGLSDGLNRPWVSTVASNYGTEDPNLYQSVEFRAGVSGTINNTTTDHPFVAHIRYVDGFNSNNDTSGLRPTRPQAAYDSYLSGGVNLGSAFSQFKEFRLKYDYDTDTATGYVDGVACGTTRLRRKFNSNGVRFHIGFTSNSSNDATRNNYWVAQVKNIKFATDAWDRIERGRLITSISGAVGTYMHDRWDRTICSGMDWVYSTDMYFPTNRKFSGYDYIASIGAMEDGHRLAELVAYIDDEQKKRVGIIGNVNTRYDSSTYLGTAAHLWDDREIGQYKMSKDVSSGMIRVYLAGSETPAIEVPYESLPSTKNQRMYYGKVRYGTWERVYETMTLSGTWTTSPNYTGISDPALGRLAFNSTARFATASQGGSARAVWDLDAGLGEVDLYVFHHATGFDAVRNAPFTITHDSVVSVPGIVGEGQVIFSVAQQTDEFGQAASNKTTIRVDQRRVSSGAGTSTNVNLAQASGWIHLGRYVNPTRVVLTASGTSSGTTSAQPFVCADAIGVDIGRYGRSTFDMSVARVRYLTGASDFPDTPYEPAGLTVIDLESNEVIDTYGEHTGPAFLDSDITSGSRR